MEKAKRMKMTEETPTPSSREVGFELQDIRTGPVKLNRFNIDRFREVCADNDKVMRFCTWDPQISIDQAIACLDDEAIPCPFFQVICNKQDVVIGLISVTPDCGIHDKCRAEVGYWLDKNYLGRGIIKRILKTVVSTIFQQRPELQRLDAKVEVLDLGSQNALGGVGFQREGVLRKYRRFNGSTVDVAMYSLLPTDV